MTHSNTNHHTDPAGRQPKQAMKAQFTNDQVSDTVNEFIADNPEFDTFYDDNVGFQAWKKEAQNIISFCSDKKTAYKKLDRFMEQAIEGAWEPRR